MLEFEITNKNIGNIRILECRGEMTADCFNYCRSIINEFIDEKNCRIVFDLKNVDYVSSTGWAIFISSLKKVRDSGGDMKIASLKLRPKHIFNILELENLIDAFSTVEEAVESYLKEEKNNLKYR